MSKDFDFFETSAIFSKSDPVSYNEDALLVRLISHKDVFADVFHLLKDFPLDVDPKN